MQIQPKMLAMIIERIMNQNGRQFLTADKGEKTSSFNAISTRKSSCFDLDIQRPLGDCLGHFLYLPKEIVPTKDIVKP